MRDKTVERPCTRSECRCIPENVLFLSHTRKSEATVTNAALLGRSHEPFTAFLPQQLRRITTVALAADLKRPQKPDTRGRLAGGQTRKAD